jgi:hypothetical protein
MAQRKKGRETRSTKPADEADDGASLIAVRLDDEQLKVRGEELVSFIVKLESLENKKGEQVKKINAEIKLCKERSRVLARELDSGEAMIDRQQALDFQNVSTGRRVGAAAAKAAQLAENDAAAGVA